MANQSSVPLRMAVVSPSKQPYSSLRNRIYYNTNPKRTGSSNPKSNGTKNAENRSTSGSKSHHDFLSAISKQGNSTHSQKKLELNLTSSAERRKNSRLLRSQGRNGTENGSGLKRKAESDLLSSKPSKARPTMQSNNMSVACQTAKKNVSKSQTKMTSSKPNSTNNDKDTLLLNDVEVSAENHECDKVLKDSPLNEDGGGGGDNVDVGEVLEYRSPNLIKQNLFPPEQENNENNFFSDVQADFQEVMQSEHQHSMEETDTVTAFFGSLGLGRKNSSEKDDASTFTDSGASTSSSDQLFSQSNASDELKDDNNELEGNVGGNDDLIDKERLTDKDSPITTPTKKSARISAKRAILEKNIDNFNDENTIWSIWGGVPPQKQQKQKIGLSDEVIQLSSHEDNVNMSPDSMSSSEIALEINKPTISTSNKVKGPRIKQTPVRIKKLAQPVPQPEKQVSVGNVVWGKVHGHPWWPGRVLAVSGNIDEGNEVTQHAHVTWFGSNTSSIMPVNELQHFLANFKRRFKKGKKGCYRKAVKQAQDMLQVMGEI